LEILQAINWFYFVIILFQFNRIYIFMEI
jgi:hypothetical protein